MIEYDEVLIEKIYAGWLGKNIGIRLGAPIEGWSYQKIKDVYGEIWNYPVEYRDFAADDDSNGPAFLVRAMEHKKKDAPLTAQDVADALLNYAPYEHGFFWWGGYGVSTEHTAYLNLRNHVRAPMSGSSVKNGTTISEQIGGQIFADCWGLISPGNPNQAAEYARQAASVTHDGNGIWGGVFIAVCISLAFEDITIEEMIDTALQYIPRECEYRRMVLCIMDYYRQDKKRNWRSCFKYVYQNFGYDLYPGYCHIIPNSAVIILSLLYGDDDFTKTLCICNMCGWDTDCNVGNVGTIMGVRKGTDGIEYERWRKPVNDLLICSGTLGDLNIVDIPYGALYMAKYAFETANKEIPLKWKKLIQKKQECCHFEYPGSTHAVRLRCDVYDGAGTLETRITNTTDQAYTGSHSLKVYAYPLQCGQQVYVYQKTYYQTEDLHDDRYEPGFSPKIYAGQKVSGNIYIREVDSRTTVWMYVKDAHSGEVIKGEPVECEPGEWTHLEFQVREKDAMLLEEVGFCIMVPGTSYGKKELMVYIDDLEYGGTPDYKIDFKKEKLELKAQNHYEFSQFTKVKGWIWAEDEWLHITCADFAEAYTGSRRFENYEINLEIRPLCGEHHHVNLRVQGAMYGYAVGFEGRGKLAILKNSAGYECMNETEYEWENGKSYQMTFRVNKDRIQVFEGNTLLLEAIDHDRPYLSGAWGVSVTKGSHCSYRNVNVRGITD